MFVGIAHVYIHDAFVCCTCIVDAKHVYVHNAFIYAVQFDATYTRQIYVLCTHNTFMHTPGFDFGAWENHEVHAERAEKSSTGETIIYSTTSSVTVNEIRVSFVGMATWRLRSVPWLLKTIFPVNY